jgi:CHAT domain-containing protein
MGAAPSVMSNDNVPLRSVRRGITTIAVALTLAAASTNGCTPSGLAGDASLDLAAEDWRALAAGWSSPSWLSVQTAPNCRTIAVASSTGACAAVGTPSPETLARVGTVAAQLSVALRRDRSTALLHRVALIDALSGSATGAPLDRAILLLDEASARSDASANVRADRAAMHLRRYAITHDVVDLLTALDASSGAEANAPASSAACWNGALSFTWLGMRAAANDAWRRCATLTGNSAVQPIVTDGGSSQSDTTRAIALAGRWPEATHEFAWLIALPQWARAARSGRQDSLRIALQLLDSTVQLTGRAGIDRPLRRARSDIAAAEHSRDAATRTAKLARAFELFAYSRSADARQNPALALRALDSAAMLAGDSVEVARWIALQRANVLMNQGKTSAARAAYEQLRPSASESLTVFATRVRWGEALTAIGLGRYAIGAAALDTVALHCAQQSLESCRYGAATFRAELYSLVGDAEASQREMQRVLTAASTAPTSQWSLSGLMLLRQLAELHGLDGASVAIDRESLALAEGWGRPDLAMLALYSRIESRLGVGDLAGAFADVRTARSRWMPRLTAADRAFYDVDLLRIEGEVRRETNPVVGRQLLDSAVTLLGAEENALRVSTIRFAHARALLSTADSTAALDEMSSVLRILAARGGGDMSVFERARLARVTDSVAMVSARTLRASGAYSAALLAFSGRPFVGQTTPPCCTQRSVSTLSARQVGDSVWIWMPAMAGVQLTVAALDQRTVAAAALFDSAALVRVYDAIIRPHIMFESDTAPLLRLDVRGALSEVPWAALRDRISGTYLIERTAIVLTGDGMTLPTAGPVAGVFRSTDRVTLIDASPATGARRLPGADREVTALRHVWRQRATVVNAAIGGAQTLRRFTGAGIVHFAGHAMLDRTRPERSYLALPSVRDSMIRADQLRANSLRNVRLLILAACETRGGGTGSQRGFDSLAGAFLAAGVESVIGSFWPVDDATTASVMLGLHTRLRAGDSPSQALRAAQRAAIGSSLPALRSPAAWAGFSVLGK